MAGKAKPKKHTAKELKQKQDAALTNKGGGKAGLQDRKGGAAGHAGIQMSRLWHGGSVVEKWGTALGLETCKTAV